MIEDKTDRLDALIEKSWMYRALKMETEIQSLREEIGELHETLKRANMAIFDRLDDIAVEVGRTRQPDFRDMLQAEWRSEKLRAQEESYKRLATTPINAIPII